MIRTQKNHLRVDKKTYRILRELTKLSKNLYNQALYIYRQHYFSKQEYISYNEVYHLVKTTNTFRMLPSQVGQWILKSVDRNFRIFFFAQKRKKKGKEFHIPNYLERDEFYMCTFPSTMLKVEGDKIRLSLGKNFYKTHKLKYLYFKLPKNIVNTKIKCVKILPRHKANWFEIEYVYDKLQPKTKLNPKKILGIDLGLNNFATCVDTSGTTFIIEGRHIKSFNRWYYKKRAMLYKIYQKQKVKGGKKLCWLCKKRKFVVNNFMNQAVASIIKYCLNKRIGKIVIGGMRGVKQNKKIRKTIKKSFMLIPYGIFKRKLKAKCDFYGIEYIEVDESYTSQTCCNCSVVRRNNRKHRGLYVCKNCGIVLNADVNSAINLIKKVAQESVKRILGSGCVNQPVRIRVISVNRNYQTSHGVLLEL